MSESKARERINDSSVKQTVELLGELYLGAEKGRRAAETMKKQSGINIFTSELEVFEDNCSDFSKDASRLLHENSKEPQQPSALDKALMWSGITLGTMTGGASELAKKCIQGCTMGVTDLTAKLNNCPDASAHSREKASEYISMLEHSAERFKEYL